MLPPVDESKAIEIRPVERTGYLILLRVLFSDYWPRSVLGATLMITQSFLYNAIFFTYTLVLTKFYNVSAANAPFYLIAFAAGNLLGPLTIGRLFDTIGCKQIIAGTYILSGSMLAVTAYLFDQGVLTALTQTIAWCVIFFFASAGASAAYLTVSEIFPLEVGHRRSPCSSRSRSVSAPSARCSTATSSATAVIRSSCTWVISSVAG